MTLESKRWIIAALGFLFLLSLVLVQWLETVARRAEESGQRGSPRSRCRRARAAASTAIRREHPGIIDHWEGSTHAETGCRLRRVPPGAEG